jgi:type II secretory pathway predicted ATPase ExeA
MSRPVKVTPDVMARVKQLRIVGHSHREVAAILSLSITTVKSVCSGSYANGFLHRAKNPHTVLNAPANTSVATDAKKRATALKTVRAKKLAPEVSHTPEAVPSTPTATEEKEDPMLLQNQALSAEARQHFKLPRNPFVDDVQSPDDVFQSPSVRYVRAALLDCAQHHGFVAVVGESGAGKSTLAEDLEERIKMDKRNVLVVRPYVLAMEANDTKGKTLKSGAIAEAIAYALDPHVSLRSSPQARFAQVHNLLKASRAGGRRHLLLIEEAHCLPLATLKHLKRFLELKDGMQRLIGVALIGQPELRERLGSQNAEVREVAQRCELVALDPLDAELEAYLQHKFARFELKLSDVFAADAFDAMRARLIHLPRGGRPADARSLCYPLVVNNLVCRAMNAAAAAHWPQVDAQVVKGC